LFLHRKKRFKTVTTELREVGYFDTLELEDNLGLERKKRNKRLKQVDE
jgi:hypothetical protein